MINLILIRKIAWEPEDFTNNRLWKHEWKKSIQ